MADVKEQLAQALFDHIPVGVGSQGIIPTSARDLEAALEMGMDWSLREVQAAASKRMRAGRQLQPCLFCQLGIPKHVAAS